MYVFMCAGLEFRMKVLYVFMCAYIHALCVWI